MTQIRNLVSEAPLGSGHQGRVSSGRAVRGARDSAFSRFGCWFG